MYYTMGALGAAKKAKVVPVTYCKDAKGRKAETKALGFCLGKGFTLQVLGCKPFKFTCVRPPSPVPVGPPSPAPSIPASPPLRYPVTPVSYPAVVYPNQPVPVYAPAYSTPGGAPPTLWETMPQAFVADEGQIIEQEAGIRPGEPGFEQLPAIGPEIEAAIYAQAPALPQGFAPIMDPSLEIPAAEVGACQDQAQNAQDEFGPFTIQQIVCDTQVKSPSGGVRGVVSSQALETQELFMQGFGFFGQLRPRHIG